MERRFREATIKDLAVIVSIYNEAISEGHQTADLEEVHIEECN